MTRIRLQRNGVPTDLTTALAPIVAPITQRAIEIYNEMEAASPVPMRTLAAGA